MQEAGRAADREATDAGAVEAGQGCAKREGRIPGREPREERDRGGEIANEGGKEGKVVGNRCGRGDKDIGSVAKHLGVEL